MHLFTTSSKTKFNWDIKKQIIGKRVKTGLRISALPHTAGAGVELGVIAAQNHLEAHAHTQRHSDFVANTEIKLHVEYTLSPPAPSRALFCYY